MKTTTGVSLEIQRTLPKNHLKSDFSYGSYKEYKDFIEKTNLKHISRPTRNQVIVDIHEKIYDHVMNKGYTVRIPGFGILALIKIHDPFNDRLDIPSVAKSKGYTYKLHVYFSLRGKRMRARAKTFQFYTLQRIRKDIKGFMQKL